MVETLVDRATQNKKFKDEMNKEKNIASEIKIDSGSIYLQDLVSNEWNLFVNLDSIVNEKLKEHVESYNREHESIISDETTRKLEHIYESVNSVWDSESQKFNITYDFNEYGQIHKLYIPFNSEYIDNIVVETIYDSDGEFVANKLEDKFPEELYKIEKYDLYANNISSNNPELYVEEQTDTKEIFKNNFKSTFGYDYDEQKNTFILEYMGCFLITILPILLYLAINSAIAATVAVLLSVVFVYPISFALTFSTPIFFIKAIIESYIESNYKKSYNIVNK